MQSYTFHIKGMHCAACVVLTETELTNIPGVAKATASLVKNTVIVTGDFGNENPDILREKLSAALTQYGYSLSEKPEEHNAVWTDFKWALPIALLFVALVLILQKAGLANLITASSVGFSTAFFIGIIASLSTCMAVVGGLVLSLSGSFAKQGSSIRPHIMFHAGRLIGFFILGGVIGLIGGAFELGAIGTSILSLLVSVVMIGLGINLLDVFPWAKRFQLTLPKSIGNKVFSLSSLNSSVMPFAVGALTFFLPCGFTQSMQLYALSTHSFSTASGIMFSFALGTLPILGLISFGSKYAERLQAKSGRLFKIMGIIVILFAIFNIVNALAALGIIPPLFNL
jgi:sulfite exporter TauE/SafE/copper chaperone CopZ